MLATYECTISALSSIPLVITIGDPRKGRSCDEYYCEVLIMPIESEPFRIIGIDADQAMSLARRFLILRFSDMEIVDENGQINNSSDYFGGA